MLCRLLDQYCLPICGPIDSAALRRDGKGILYWTEANREGQVLNQDRGARLAQEIEPRDRTKGSRQRINAKNRRERLDRKSRVGVVMQSLGYIFNAL